MKKIKDECVNYTCLKYIFIKKEILKVSDNHKLMSK